jgi:hypothetical protein
MRRREFIAVLPGAPAWPMAAPSGVLSSTVHLARS